MQKFKYNVVDSNNQKRNGELEGESLEQVGDLLLGQGFVILELKPVGFNLDTLNNINIGGVPFSEKVVFMRQMSFMLNSGLPLNQALSIAREQINNNSFKNKMNAIIRDVESGAPLSRALNKQGDLFDAVIRNLIKAGEESGKLDMIMERIADDMEKKQDFEGKVKGALIYPIVIIIAIIGVVIALLVFMVPEMSKLYADQGSQLPLPTQLILNLSNFLTVGQGGIITAMVLIGIVAGFFYYRSTPSGRLVTDKYMLKIPIFGDLSKKTQVANFARTFSMLITAGVPILDALKLVGDSTTNTYFQLDIFEARKKVEKGVPLSLPMLNSEAFPELMGHMIKVGEETGKLDEVILKVGNQYAKEVDSMASNLTRLMEPVILIMMGVVVGGLALAVYLPILNLGTTLTK